MTKVKNVSEESFQGVEFTDEDGKVERFDLPAGEVNELPDAAADYAVEQYPGRVKYLDDVEDSEESGEEVGGEEEEEEEKPKARKRAPSRKKK